MTVDVLADRYRRLLACYPRWYREERGAELVGTLLDGARPGPTRPTWRETRALVVEGLRPRAGTSGHRTARASLVGGLQMAVLLFGLVAAGRFGLAVPAAVVAGVVTTGGYRLLVDEMGSPVYRQVVAAVLILAGVVALAFLSRNKGQNQGRITARPVMPAWALVPPLILVLPGYVYALRLGEPDDIFRFANLVVYVVIYLGALAYAGVDPRPALAIAPALTILLVEIVVMVAQLSYRPGGVLVVVAGHLAFAAPAGVAGWLGLRWQRAIRPLGVRS